MNLIEFLRQKDLFNYPKKHHLALISLLSRLYNPLWTLQRHISIRPYFLDGFDCHFFLFFIFFILSFVCLQKTSKRAQIKPLEVKIAHFFQFRALATPKTTSLATKALQNPPVSHFPNSKIQGSISILHRTAPQEMTPEVCRKRAN